MLIINDFVVVVIRMHLATFIIRTYLLSVRPPQGIFMYKISVYAKQHM